jgi:hypothetical protein
VGAVFHYAARVVVRGAGHGQQRGAARLAEHGGLGDRRLAGADRLVGQAQVDAGVAHELVEPVRGELLAGQREQAERQVVAHQRERLVAGVPEPLERDDLAAGR